MCKGARRVDASIHIRDGLVRAKNPISTLLRGIPQNLARLMLTNTASVADREHVLVKKDDGLQVVIPSPGSSVETAIGAAEVHQPHHDLFKD